MNPYQSKMSDPKITVLMSVYNGEKYLKEAIDSILNQTFKDFEFLIINDGSTDKTAEILQSYDDPRIKIVNNDKNMDLTKSLNKGLRIARGKYIARMDADDVSLPQRFKKQVDYLEENVTAGLVGTFSYTIGEGGEILNEGKPPSENKEIKKALLKGNQFCGPSVMFREKCIDRIGFFREEFRYAQDYDLWLRIADKYDVANIPEPLYERRIHSGCISIRKLLFQSAYGELAKGLGKKRVKFGKDSLELLSHRKREPFVRRKLLISTWRALRKSADDCRGYCKLFFCEGQARKAKTFLRLALLYNPLSCSAWHLWVLCNFGEKWVERIRRLKKRVQDICCRMHP